MQKARKTFRIFSLCILTTSLFSSCLKNDNETIALPEIGTAANVIPPEIREEFESQMTIYEGVNPPDITGSFVMSKSALQYSSDGYTSSNWADHYMAFHSRKGNTYKFNGKQLNSEEYSPSVVVIGKGMEFTAYYTSEAHHDDGKTWSKTANLTSGTITESGIKNLTHAFIMLDKNDPDGRLMEVNEYRIFYDQDRLAANSNWYNIKSLIESDESNDRISIYAKQNK